MSSDRFGYEWTVPAGWELTSPPPKETGPRDDLEVRRGHDDLSLTVTVTDYAEVVPGKHVADDPQRFEKMTRYGTELLKQAGAKVERTRRVPMLGDEVIEVSGSKDDVPIAIRLLYRDRRHFEFRCIGDAERDWSCAAALTNFRILEATKASAPPDEPRVRHLHEPRLGLAFDAPDDTWLSVGPRVGGGGAQSVWIWAKAGRQIDVQTLDLSGFKAKPDTAAFAAGMADKERAGGVTVNVSDASFAGQTWRHLEMTGGGKSERDAYMLVKNDVMYGILITEPERDPALLKAAMKGFRFVPRAR